VGCSTAQHCVCGCHSSHRFRSFSAAPLLPPPDTTGASGWTSVSLCPTSGSSSGGTARRAATPALLPRQTLTSAAGRALSRARQPRVLLPLGISSFRGLRGRATGACCLITTPSHRSSSMCSRRSSSGTESGGRSGKHNSTDRVVPSAAGAAAEVGSAA
jgi:hypothetical protein